MSMPETLPAQTKPKKRGGCLKGCLIGLLVFLLLVAGCTGGTYLLGRSYIARQLPAWEERYAWLGPTLTLFRYRSDIETTLVHQGADDRSLLPGDIPLHPEPLVENLSLGRSHGAVYQQVAKPPEQLQEYLRGAMLQNGWKLDIEWETAGGSHLLYWEKDERSCVIEVVTCEGGSELWLRYTDEAPSPD